MKVIISLQSWSTRGLPPPHFFEDWIFAKKLRKWGYLSPLCKPSIKMTPDNFHWKWYEVKGVLPTKFSAKKELRIWGVPPPHPPFAEQSLRSSRYLTGSLKVFYLVQRKNFISFNVFFLHTFPQLRFYLHQNRETRQEQKKKGKPGWIRCFWGWCLLPAVLESTAPKLLLPRSPWEIAINSEIYTGKAVQVLIESSAPHSQPPGKELSGAWLTALHLSLSSL